MARGKLKYRDVVGGRSKKSSKKKIRQRKTYSLYQHDNKKLNKKRKHVVKNEDSVDGKRQKLEQEEFHHEEESSENEDSDNMKQLRASFSSRLNNKQSHAIDSSEDSLSEEESDKEENAAFDSSAEQTSINNKLSENEEDVQESNDEMEIEAEVSHDGDGDDNMNDPFVKHLFYELHEDLLNSLQNIPVSVKDTFQYWSKLGRLIIQMPVYTETEEKKENRYSILEEKKVAPPGSLPQAINNKDLLNLENLFIKPQIINNLSKANKSVDDSGSVFTQLQCELFSIINNYQDLYFCERNFTNSEEIRFVYCLHAVNHILKTRMKVVHHNVRLSKKDDVSEEFRDQGLVRPKILMVVPFKDSAYKIVQMLINILLPEDKGHVMNKKRFIEEYTGNEIAMPKKNPKPEDYELTFTGNSNDDFKIGMTVTKKSLKLYADFYSSDIIIASPLGLRTIIGAEGEPERDYDFLASIELLILDQTELFLMQNWDHLIHIFTHLHLQPKDSHGTDFSRFCQKSIQFLIRNAIITLEKSKFPIQLNLGLLHKCLFKYRMFFINLKRITFNIQ
ncbi:digestive organ expansion factor -like [Asbolus verrucosus]|uniref:Digestive organ expansion factor-like n=1 Tax=Asbolus verrucosus TaxID=1661398 RepID=A0A482VIV2_ASBVE|nr:digestive organ expansion factor -like [Asbolus verrucosus]